MIKESIHSTITVSISKQFEMAQPFFLPSLAGNFGHVALEQYWFRFQTFHVLNLTHWIEYMKSLMSESIRKAYEHLFWFGAILPAWTGREFWTSDFVVALIQMPNLSCAEPNTFESSTLYMKSLMSESIRKRLQSSFDSHAEEVFLQDSSH